MQSLHEYGAVYGTARQATPADEIDGVSARAVVEPESPEALAGVLAAASQDHRALVLRGGGTKMGWGRPPADLDLIVSTRRLNRVLAHAHGDLTATVEAGTTVRALNDTLARHGQWLPIDIAFDEATIGGVIAANEAGPLRHRHGTPRDLLIGVHLAMTDGRVVKAGGTVVKNVAGYDLGKLVSGSHGTLAAIVSATFKLAPLPTAAATLVASFREPAQMARAVSAMNASQLEPAAFDVRAGSDSSQGGLQDCRLLVQFASVQAAVDAQAGECARVIEGDHVALLTGAEELDLWRRQVRDLWARAAVAEEIVVRASWLPANLERVLTLVGEISRGGLAVDLAGRAGVGAGLIRLEGGRAASLAALTRLRAADCLGHLVVLRADAEVKAAIDVWGSPGDRAQLMKAVKRALDPAGILNAGRGPL